MNFEKEKRKKYKHAIKFVKSIILIVLVKL